MKPEKKKPNNIYSESYGDGEIEGYNQACDDWEKHLPTKDELRTIVNDIIVNHSGDDIAEVIDRRIRR